VEIMDPATPAAAAADAAGALALAYHLRTRHHLERYAAGPEALDWTAQPNPFREYQGSARTALPLHLGAFEVSFAALHGLAGREASPLSVTSVGALLGLSLALSAWKEYGRDRWALRCNPSSGNLHPTEGYVICEGVPGLTDGVHHYVSRDHVLEQRCAVQWGEAGAAAARRRSSALWIALSSVHWREAWKYGERAYRYCQLDAGHAVGAIAYAAAVLGWTARLVDCDDTQLAALLGVDRDQDYGGAEHEHPDLLLAILPQTSPSRARVRCAEARAPVPHTVAWAGHANVLDPHPLHHWPVIDAVASAARRVSRRRRQEPDQRLLRARSENLPDSPAAVKLIQGRRSAQSFDRRYTMTDSDFFRLLESLSPRHALPWHLWRYRAHIHLALFVHRVSGLAPGLYALPRHTQGERLMRSGLHQEFLWRRVEHAPGDLPLFQLFPGDFRQAARTLSCHQGIAGDSAFCLAMLAELGPVVRAHAWRYRQLFWEAGLLGQVLYLQAESLGVRGTGIGCYFDEVVQQVLGAQGDALAPLYHFTVGQALPDERIRTIPPYPAAP
jgi:SagB-type dehydrogenase family enzyme